MDARKGSMKLLNVYHVRKPITFDPGRSTHKTTAKTTPKTFRHLFTKVPKAMPWRAKSRFALNDNLSNMWSVARLATKPHPTSEMTLNKGCCIKLTIPAGASPQKIRATSCQSTLGKHNEKNTSGSKKITKAQS